MPLKLIERLAAIRAASTELRNLPADKKNEALRAAARLLRERQTEILIANASDLRGLPVDTTPAFRDRLLLNEKRIGQIVESLLQVAELADPVNEIVSTRTLPNGLKLERVRSPLGVIFMIFESRPNVAVEAFSMAFKSGNAIILRGGKESVGTTRVIYEILSAALAANGVPTDVLWGITDPNRELVAQLLREKKWIDLVVPRGGESLIRNVEENSLIPVIKNDRGLCHVYVHEDADLEMAARIVHNSKVHRPGVCNSMETVLVHEKIKARFLPLLYDVLKPQNVEWYADAATLETLGQRPGLHAATAESFDTEYLDLKMSCAVVPSYEAALAHIEAHGSRHSECIVTASPATAKRFQNEVDAAAVYWNASTRFTDGFEFGLGGELGISTQKLHVRGPVGLKELTSARWIINGSGQVRE
jgi:glutamate-5-semialdehyde dehydrogenase